MPGSEGAMASPPLPVLPPSPPEQNSPPPQQTEAPPQRPNPDVAFRLWPPTQPTRDAIVSRVVETLSAPSALSTRYGRLSLEEATSVARAIEQEEYASTVAAASASDDGADVLQAYARAIARRMLDSVHPRTARDRGYLQPKTPEVLDVSPSFDPEVERSSSF
ncbi:WPP domain-containing protein 1-like isoform X1 [Rhodamnia argentea]|uniref:WPP domain-containing protein 1-like n=1 Tax=Rhodamnia argentea TaxID=178133 RepID=A0A8B8PT62_9MYRT|nr:WPP domain-containing protein 1-like isoform X1 [Rhodamnia argentea]XP_030537959.1 WPP domain-containing protein 1-like isoform X1 [Rhodamnia argentea]XP_030537960.1 WPP domain-containing protein 1-like isoform X1 [Rhodamnia argentea]XP_030537961.1 WPP domain-containing protein 1-like isoform X1 [Rhodamnia argentea]XP_030537962.1 WPP domain-containing protein 1-like isoform X1 [Rhodamnia argentea]XP_030537963.1 WPP domain-containing protein 1-like isoform X1 [Rhodamnia argentea]XP_04813083